MGIDDDVDEDDDDNGSSIRITSKAAMNEESETGVMVVVAVREKIIMGLIEGWWRGAVVDPQR